MTIDPWILAFSAFTVIATIWVGFWSARRSKTAHDFYVAGRSVSVGWNASAISGEYLSAASFMGVAGMVMSSGYDALWYPVCYACGYLFLLLFIAGPLRRFGAYTIPDFAEGRFDSPLFRKIAVVFVLFIGFFYTMPQMKGAGTTLAYIFPGLPYWAGVVLVGAVITLNVALGGMKGITLVQAFQYWAKMFAISVPIFVLMAVYGHYGDNLHLNSTGRISDSRDKQMHFRPLNWGYGSINGNSNRIYIAYWLTKDRINKELTKGDWSYAETEQNVYGAMASYSELTGRRLIYSTNIVLLIQANRQNFPIAQAFSKDVRINQLTAGLTSRGVVLLDFAEFIAAVPKEDEAEARKLYTTRGPLAFSIAKSLPDKAPNDETWVNPFGPLTTKAAKAAKPLAIRFDGELIVVNKTLLNGRLMSFPEPQFLARNRGPRKEQGITPATYPASDFFEIYAEVVLLGETASGHEFSARHSKQLEAASIAWTNTAWQPRRKLARSMEAAMAVAGITVLRESENIFKAFLTKEAIITPVDPRPYSLLYTYSLIIALVCGTAGLPHILVRFYTNPDGVAAKRTTMWVMILIGIFYVFPPVFGVMGRNLLPELYAGVGAKGTDKIVLELPRILNERYAPLGSILSGITCAGAFAAFMSTFSGLLVSMTGALAHDVYGRMFKPKSTPEQRLRAFKVCTVVIGGIAIVLGCFVEPLEINFMVGQAFAIAAASYFPLLFMSVWWRGMTMRGAATGMLTGGLCALAAVTLTNVSNLALDKGPMGKIFAGFAPLNEFWAGHPLLRILCEQPAIWTVPLAIGLMIVIGKLTSHAVPPDTRMKMLVLHAPETLGLKQEYIQEHQHGG